jgi:hypothetical protein
MGGFGMIWDKREDESSKAYEWFCRYRDMGPGRSHEKLNQKYAGSRSNKSLTLRWSSKYAWVERAEAYDVYLEGKKRESNEERTIKAAEEQIDLSDRVMEILLRKLPQMEYGEIKPTEWKNLAEFAVKTKRDALGIADKHEVSGEIHVDHEIGRKLSEEMMERTRRLLGGLDGDA